MNCAMPRTCKNWEPKICLLPVSWFHVPCRATFLIPLNVLKKFHLWINMACMRKLTVLAVVQVNTE